MTPTENQLFYGVLFALAIMALWLDYLSDGSVVSDRVDPWLRRGAQILAGFCLGRLVECA